MGWWSIISSPILPRNAIGAQKEVWEVRRRLPLSHSSAEAYGVTTGTSTLDSCPGPEYTLMVAGLKSAGLAFMMFGTKVCGFRS